MTNGELLSWRHRLGWTQEAAAIQLGCSRRAYQRYEAGPVPREVELACWALEYGPRRFRIAA
jgi:transcriptional regulator with XRE-family HTH domain